MNETILPERMAEASPRFRARMAGAFQLLESLTATFGQVIVLGKLVVSGNAAATAANILGHEPLYWLGFASSLLAVVFHVVYAVLFYDLLKPVNRRVSLLALLVLLLASAIQAVTGLLYLAPLLVLQGGGSLSAFTTEQLQALAMVFLKLNAYALNVHLVFFGFWCILTGYLIFKSTFLPKVLGALLMISGLGWVIYLYPPLAYSLFLYIAGASALGEIPVEFWLMVKAVNAERWKQRARAASVFA